MLEPADLVPSRADYSIGPCGDQLTHAASRFCLTTSRNALRLRVDAQIVPLHIASLSEGFPMVWWYWMVLGLVLLGAEMATPGGFYIIFFGLAALIVGTLAGTGTVQTDWLQWLLFSVVAVGSLLVFRGPLLAKLSPHAHAQPDIDSMVGETAIPLEPLAAGGIGKAELRGTTWTAKNVGAEPLLKGQRGKVARVEGLTLWITNE